MKSLILIAAVAMLSLLNVDVAKAQTNDLTSEQLEMFKEEVKHRVERFQRYLTFIASKKNDVATKKEYVKQTLKLFIGKGEPYKDVNDNVIPAVRMQLSDTKTKKKYWRKTKDYLNNLINLPYQKLEITWVDVCRVSEPYKVRDGLYVATVAISQRFAGIRDNRVIENIDDKVITVYLEENVTSVGGHYKVLFGDIEVVHTY